MSLTLYLEAQDNVPPPLSLPAHARTQRSTRASGPNPRPHGPKPRIISRGLSAVRERKHVVPIHSRPAAPYRRCRAAICLLLIPGRPMGQSLSVRAARRPARQLLQPRGTLPRQGDYHARNVARAVLETRASAEFRGRRRFASQRSNERTVRLAHGLPRPAANLRAAGTPPRRQAVFRGAQRTAAPHPRFEHFLREFPRLSFFSRALTTQFTREAGISMLENPSADGADKVCGVRG